MANREGRVVQAPGARRRRSASATRQRRRRTASAATARSSAPVRSQIRTRSAPVPSATRAVIRGRTSVERRLVEAFGERRQELVRGGPIPVDEPVGESLSAPADRLERDRRHGRRGHGREDVRSIAAADDGPDTGHDHRVDRRDRRPRGSVDDRAVRHDLDAAEVMPEQRDRRRGRGGRAPARAGTRPRTGHRSDRRPSAPAAIATTRSAAARTATTASHRSGCRSDEEARRNRTTTETTTTIAAAAKASEIATNSVSATDARPGIETGLVIGSPVQRLRHVRDDAEDRQGEHGRSRTAATAVTAGRPVGNTSRYRTIPGQTVTTRSHEFSPQRPRSRARGDPSRSATVRGRVGAQSSPRARDRSAAAATRRRSAAAATRSDRRPPRSTPPPARTSTFETGSEPIAPSNVNSTAVATTRSSVSTATASAITPRPVHHVLSLPGRLAPGVAAAAHGDTSSGRRSSGIPLHRERGLSSMCRLRPVATVGSSIGAKEDRHAYRNGSRFDRIARSPPWERCSSSSALALPATGGRREGARAPGRHPTGCTSRSATRSRRASSRGRHAQRLRGAGLPARAGADPGPAARQARLSRRAHEHDRPPEAPVSVRRGHAARPGGRGAREPGRAFVTLQIGSNDSFRCFRFGAVAFDQACVDELLPKISARLTTDRRDVAGGRSRRADRGLELPRSAARALDRLGRSPTTS